MIRFQGENHPLYPSRWGGQYAGYLCNDTLETEPPTGMVYRGYIVTQEGVVAVYRSRIPWRLLLVLSLVAVAVTVVLRQSPTVLYYPVSFAERPVLKDKVLYCTVVNISDRETTVWFKDELGNTTPLTLLRPGETIPTVEVDFVPTCIEYDQKYQFELEVQYD